MSPEKALELVERARVAHLATVTKSGTPHIVPCCFVLDGEVIYSAVDAKPKSTLALKRLANIAAAPVASLLVDHYDEDWTQLWWVRVDGTASIVADPDERRHALLMLTDKYIQYQHEAPAGPVIAVHIERVRNWP